MKLFFSVIILLTLSGCASQKQKDEPKCPEIFKSDFSEIIIEKYQTSYKGKTVFYHQLRFQCVYSSLYTHKVMYDNFGKWDKEVVPENQKYPFLIWNNVDLFSTGKKYKVVTSGLEEWKHIYAAVMVFDEDENDLLGDSSAEKTALIDLFSEMIKNLDDAGGDFYEVFWKNVDPNRWEIIKKYRKK